MRPPAWCPAAPLVTNRSRSRPFFLVAALHVRLYDSDPAKLTVDDLLHWLAWHRYAGVEKVFVYDAHLRESERFGGEPRIRAAARSGFLEYVDWGAVARRNVRADGSLAGKHVAAVQLPAARDAHRRAVDVAKWMLLVDVDEYASVDADEPPRGFLGARVRAESRRAERGRPVRVSQLVLPTVIFEGPRDGRRGPMLARQVSRKRDAAHNRSATKAIVRLDAVEEYNVHKSAMTFGRTVAVARSSLFVRHYHAGRSVGYRSWPELRRDPVALGELLGRTEPADCRALCDAVLACDRADDDAPPLALGAAAVAAAALLLACRRRRGKRKGAR